MPVRHRISKRRVATLDDAWVAWLWAPLGTWTAVDFLADDDAQHAVWRDHGAAVVRAWIRDRPGTRPARFWQFSDGADAWRWGEPPTPQEEAQLIDKLAIWAPGERDRAIRLSLIKEQI